MARNITLYSSILTFALQLLIFPNQSDGFPQARDTVRDDSEENLLSPPKLYEAVLSVDMLKKKEQMYLQTLNQLIPAMESLKQELVSKIETNSGIEEESEIADLKMLIIENQLQAGQSSVKKFRLLHEKFNSVTNSSHQLLSEMNNVYNNHSQAPEFILTSQNLAAITALKQLLTTKPYPTDQILRIIHNQTTEAGRLVLQWKLLQDIEVSKEALNESPLLIRLGTEINQTLASHLGRSSLPEMVRDIFTEGRKVLKSAKTGRDLILNVADVRTTIDHSMALPSWRFIPTSGRKSFLIQHSESNLVLGVAPRGDQRRHQHGYFDRVLIEPDWPTTEVYEEESTSPPKIESLKFDAEMQLEMTTGSMEAAYNNSAYHWDIVTAFGHNPNPNRIYLKFLNVASGQALDADAHGSVYPHKVNDAGFQNWIVG